MSEPTNAPENPYEPTKLGEPTPPDGSTLPGGAGGADAAETDIGLTPRWAAYRYAKRAVAPLFAVVLFAMAVRLLVGEAKKTSWDEFVGGFTSVPGTYLALAAILVAMNYVLLSTYDMLALRYLKRSLPLRRVLLVSFLGYSLGNNLGTLLAATPLRFRFYTRWGVPPHQIVALIAMLGLTFWSGLWFLGGSVLVAVPVRLPDEIRLPVGTRTLGAVLLSLAVIYLGACCFWRRPVGPMRLRLPSPGLMLTQASVAAVDLFISATALYLVLPSGASINFSLVLAAYLTALAISLITQVPGGLGVLDAILLFLMKDSVGGAVLSSILLFRCLYYFAPLVVGVIVLVVHELYSGAVMARTAEADA